MASNQFQSGATIIQFPKRPTLEGNGYTPELFQVSGYDSAGNQYVYDKGWICRLKHELAFPDVPGAVFAALRSFFNATVRGNFHSFTWYDHDEAAHTVRLSEAIGAVPTGPDRWRISLKLEEDVPWGAPSPAGTWRDKVCAPLWILKLTINSVAYYLSDGTVTVTPWGVATVPWVGSWGSIRTGISGSLAEFQVSSFDVSLLSDPAATPNMEALATTYPLEKSPAELYLWTVGTSEAPILVFRGHVEDHGIPDETTVNLTIQDETSRLRANIGTLVDRTAYPEADPDDVGRVIPIVYGSVEKLPALAVDAGHMTTLVNDIDGDDTSLVFTDVTGFSIGTKFWIDQEKMTITGISGATVSVTRNVDSTTPQNHGKAATIWEDKTEFAYLAADHPVDAIPKVCGKVGEGLLDITSICTRYIGQGGNVHSSYPGKAVVTVPGYVTAAQAVALGFLDAGSVVGSISLQSLIALLDPGHSHNSAVSSNQNTTTSLPASTGTYAGSGVIYPWNGYNGDGFYYTLNFPTDITGRTQVSYSITVKKKVDDANGDQLWIRVNGTLYWWQDRYFDALAVNSEVTITFTVTNATDCNANAAIVYFLYPNNHFEITAASRTIQTSSNQSSSNSTGQSISAGDIEISGNSVANTLVGDFILVNVVRVLKPAEVFTDLLCRAGSSAIAVLYGALPTSYAINGAITEYREGREWLYTIAFQLRCWFVLERGLASLIVRPSTLTSTRTISACRITKEGVKVHQRRKASTDDILNRINLLYNRDWSQSSGDKAYQDNIPDSDLDSIADFGEHENKDLTRCDFIAGPNGATMAADVVDYLLTRHGGRPWLHEFETYIDYQDVRFGQVVTLGFAGDKVGIIIEAGPSPGSAGTMDGMKFTMIE